MIDNNKTLARTALAIFIAFAFAACGGGGGGGSSSVGGGGGSGGGGSSPPGGGGGSNPPGGGGSNPPGGGVTPPPVSCATPMPPMTMDQSVVVDVPSDLDATATPTPTSTTTINFTVLYPERCAGETFPLILQSHGYGGTRIKTLAADGALHPDSAHFASINELVQALPFHDYVVISFDERGHGAAPPAMAAHNARIIDPNAEIRDARAILDWAFDNAAANFIQTESGTGIAKDLRMGTIGLSYGGGFQMTLAALDPRIDAIVPNGTWNNLLYSLLPGDGLKLGFSGLLCVLALNGNVNNTPLVAALCNLVGPLAGPAAAALRTRTDLSMAATRPTTLPRPAANEEELVQFFYTHGAGYLEVQERNNQPWGFGETQAKLRPVPALFIQGNRDTLFNLTDAYFNYRYYSQAGGDVRLLSTEGGHMNPLAMQVEGSANCGGVIGVASILGWFDQKLKGIASPEYTAIPRVCISVTDTPASGTAPTNMQLFGVALEDFPVGSLIGAGSVPAKLATLSATVPPLSGSTPVFAPVITIGAAQAGAVLAGAPRIKDVTVTSGSPLPLVSAVAYVGVGILRAGVTILVDDEVTPFADIVPAASDGGGSSRVHTNNRGVKNSSVLLPAVGERLQVGDVVGLLFYEQHVQYLAVGSGGSMVGPPNPYSVIMTDVELPILIPGTFAGSSLSIPRL